MWAGVTCEVEDGVASAQMAPCFSESGEHLSLLSLLPGATFAKKDVWYEVLLNRIEPPPCAGPGRG